MIAERVCTNVTREKIRRSMRGKKFKQEPASIEKFVANGTVVRGDDVYAERSRYAQRLAPMAYERLDRCPRCGGALQEEPAQWYCRWSCTRIFPRAGGSLTRQYEYELASGLV